MKTFFLSLTVAAIVYGSLFNASCVKATVAKLGNVATVLNVGR